jgi:hypothetical protein
MYHGRATNLADMLEYAEGFITDESKRRARAFSLQPSDVVISPFGKSGTTLLQHIVHGLRTRGDLNFGEISQVIPWMEAAHDVGIDLTAPQPHPRAFKSHMSWQDIPNGGRYIVSFRDPKDVLVSRYRFFEGWLFEPGSIPFSDIARGYFYNLGGPYGYWRHLRSWWEQRENPDVLLLSFEDMIRDTPRLVRTMAQFCRIELDPELAAIVEKQSTFDFMKAHKSHFDERLMRERSEKIFGFPPGADTTKVRAGKPGAHIHELPPDLSEEMDSIWRKEIGETLGFDSYSEFRQAVVALKT